MQSPPVTAPETLTHALSLHYFAPLSQSATLDAFARSLTTFHEKAHYSYVTAVCELIGKTKTAAEETLCHRTTALKRIYRLHFVPGAPFKVHIRQKLYYIAASARLKRISEGNPEVDIEQTIALLTSSIHDKHLLDFLEGKFQLFVRSSGLLQDGREPNFFEIRSTIRREWKATYSAWSPHPNSPLRLPRQIRSSFQTLLASVDYVPAPIPWSQVVRNGLVALE